jgi:nitrogen fixation protein NifB
LRVQHLSVTINGFDPSIVAQIQPTVTKGDHVYFGPLAAEILVRNQEEGLQAAVESGMFVKVNCVVVPEINGAHVLDTAQKVRELGAGVFNPIPLIPRGRFRNMNKPDERYMERLRSLCSSILPVFGQCKQCRADAEGIPGKEQAR